MIQGVLAAVLWSDEQHFKKYNSPSSSELVGKLSAWSQQFFQEELYFKSC